MGGEIENEMGRKKGKPKRAYAFGAPVSTARRSRPSLDQWQQQVFYAQSIM